MRAEGTRMEVLQESTGFGLGGVSPSQLTMDSAAALSVGSGVEPQLQRIFFFAFYLLIRAFCSVQSLTLSLDN